MYIYNFHIIYIYIRWIINGIWLWLAVKCSDSRGNDIGRRTIVSRGLRHFISLINILFICWLLQRNTVRIVSLFQTNQIIQFFKISKLYHEHKLMLSDWMYHFSDRRLMYEDATLSFNVRYYILVIKLSLVNKLSLFL